MKNLLSITTLLSASLCFAGSIANERTAIPYQPGNTENTTINDQDTTMNNRKRPKNNRKRDMGDTTEMRPDKRTDTTDLINMPVDTLPGHAPKHRM